MGSDQTRAQQPDTLREILAQPQAWRESLSDFKSSAVLQTLLDKTASRSEWLFVGCGTSFYLAEAAAASWHILRANRHAPFPRRRSCCFPR